MAGSKSDYLENKMNDHVLGNTPYSAPATVYLGAYTASPSDSGGGTEVSTSGGTLYARVAVTNNTTNWPNSSGGLKSNGTQISFPVAGSNWGTVTALGIFDSDTGGSNNLLYWGTLTASKQIDTNDQLVVPVGDFDIQED